MLSSKEILPGILLDHQLISICLKSDNGELKPDDDKQSGTERNGESGGGISSESEPRTLEIASDIEQSIALLIKTLEPLITTPIINQ